MKEKVLAAFAELGFELTPVDEFGYSFEYENIHLLYTPTDNDEEFLCICIPGFYELESENAMAFIELMHRINSTLKYVKAYALGENLWLFYERELQGNEDLPQLISRMVLHLEAALIFARKALSEILSDDKSCEDEDGKNDNE